MNSSTLHHHYTPLHFTSSKRHRLIPSSSFQTPRHRHHHHHHHHLRRHLRRNLLKKPLPTTTPPPLSPEPSSSTQTLHLQIPLPPQNYLNTLLITSKSHLNKFILTSQDAIQDLSTLITFNNSNNEINYSTVYPHSSGPGRVVVSCKRSTVEFLGTVLVSSFVIVYAFRVVLKVGMALFSWNSTRVREGNVVYKADRSLGGKLVPVGSNDRTGSDYVSSKRDGESFLDWGGDVKELRTGKGKTNRVPEWWPKENVGNGIGGLLGEEEKEGYQKLANRFIRAMLDNRLRGNDITEDDIIQFRRLCKTYGLKVSIDTANSRDSLYRTSVNFVLDYCEKQANESASMQIDNEDVQQFIAGLANNIGLEDTRAVKMVSAAVAARTRSRFLQAWALEMQGKHSEAVMELQKVCFIHQIFPPEEYSPEMEMVARGLNNHLKQDQRESLMNTLTSVCGEDTPRSVVEALGLIQ